MGNSSWSSDAYARFSSSTQNVATDDIFIQNRKHEISNDLSPYGLKIRESCDSVEHPKSLAIQVWLDVTGSMGRIPDKMVREKLGTLMDSLIANGIADAHVLFGAIGDHLSDSAPLQVSQFEAGNDELVKWLTSVWIEGNGGGQIKESYLLAWLIAARHTSIDCFNKRQEKGFLFTIGDESTHPSITGLRLAEIMGYESAETVTAEQLLAEASEKYHVFHIHINEGSYKNNENVMNDWKKLLHERFIILNDYNKISELISATVAVIHGVDINDSVKNMTNEEAVNIKSSLKDIVTKFKQHIDDEVVSL